MSHIAAVTPYVQLYTYSQYESHSTVPDWALAALVVVVFIVITAIFLMLMISDTSGWVGVAYCVTVVLLIVAAGICSAAISKPPERTGDVVDDNVALIEKSYKIRDIQPETPDSRYWSGEDSIERFAAPDSNKKPVRMAVTAQSENGDGLLHLTLQKDPGNLVRAYEGTGDTQHLITPAAHADNTRQKGQS